MSKENDPYKGLNYIDKSHLERLNSYNNQYPQKIQYQPNRPLNEINHQNQDDVPDYETLQNLYMKHLIQNQQKNDYENFSVQSQNDNYSVQNHSLIQQPQEQIRQNLNQNPNNFQNENFPQKKLERPSADQDIKKKQKDEYRKVLENQIRENNERKQKEKLENRGLNIVQKRPISSFQPNHNQNPGNYSNVLPSSLNNMNQGIHMIQNNNTSPLNIPSHNQNQNNYIPQNYVEPQKFATNQKSFNQYPPYEPQIDVHNHRQAHSAQPNNISLQSSKITNLNYDNKNNDKQKKIEYQNILKQQMEDKKSRLEEEKRKRQEEERKIEEQIRVMVEKEQEKEKEEAKKKQLMYPEMSHVVQGKKTVKDPNLQSLNSTPMNQDNIANNANYNIPSNQSNNNTNFNTLNNMQSNPYIPSQNNAINQQVQNDNRLNYHSRINQNQFEIQTENYMNIPSNEGEDELFQQREQSNKISPPQNFHITQQSNPNLLENFKPLNSPYNDDFYQSNKFQPQMNYNIPQHSQIGFNPNMNMNNSSRQINPYANPSLVDELCRQFWQEQMRLIGQHQNNVMEVMKERDNAIKETLLLREKMLFQNQLNLEKEKMENSLGYMPFDSKTYQKNLNEMMVNSRQFDNQSSRREVFPTFRNKNEKISSASPQKNNDSLLKFVSKYENLNDSDYDQSGTFQCLDGVSKLLKIEPKDKSGKEEEFYETWRDDETRQNISNISKLKTFNEKSENNVSISRLTPVKESKEVSRIQSSKEKFNSVVNDKYIKEMQVEEKLHNENQNKDLIKEFHEKINDSQITKKISETQNQEEEENYEESKFEVIEENNSEKNEFEVVDIKEDLNLDDYKEIKQEEEIKTKMNFFEQSNENLLRIGNDTNLIRPQHPNYSIIQRNEEEGLNEDSEFIENGDLEQLDNNDRILNSHILATTNNNINTIQRADTNFFDNTGNKNDFDFKVHPYKPDPKERLPRDISSNNFDKINNFYERYNLLKQEGKKENLHEPNFFDESVLKDENKKEKNFDFSQNLEDSMRRFRPFTAHVRDQFDTSKLINTGVNITNNLNTSTLPKYENKKFSYNIKGDFSHVNITNHNEITNCQKINPINDLNNEDSYIKDLTKYRKFALNEIESPNVSVSKRESGIDNSGMRNLNNYNNNYSKREMKSSLESNRYQDVSRSEK